MNVKIISIGRKRPDEYQRLEHEYLKRLRPFMNVSLLLLKPFKPGVNIKSDLIMDREGGEILKRISNSSFVCSLDRSGKPMSSAEFAQFFNKIQISNAKELDFIIGGALGLGKNVIDRSDFVLSLSGFTFPHNMVPLILFEQLYRAHTILHGMQYHK